MIDSLSSQELQFYYENEAKEVPIFGSLREISLAENIIHELPKGFTSLIDVGCGDGYLLYCLHKQFPSSIRYGFDLSTGRLKTTSQKVLQTSLIQGSSLQLPFKDSSFDVVVCSQLLEHIQDINAMTSELLHITKKHLIISVPYELELIPITCPSCKKKHYLDGHLHVFNEEKLRQLFTHQRIKKLTIKKFHTIYTYNKKTMKLPCWIRLGLDNMVVSLEKYISFFKPNFILIKIEK